MDAATLNQAFSDLVRAKNAMDSALKAQSESNVTFASISQQKAARDDAAASAVAAYNAALDSLAALLPQAKLIIPQGKAGA